MGSPRVEMVLPVRFSVDTRAVQTTTRELSEDGVFVRCLEPPAAGAQVMLKLYLPGFSNAAEFIGQVREVDQSQGGSGFWADFLSASHDAHERLLGLLRPEPRPQAKARPVPLGSLYKRMQVNHPAPSGLPPPPAAPSGVPLPEELSPQPGEGAGVAGLIQGALDEEIAREAAEALRGRKKGSGPGKKKASRPGEKTKPRSRPEVEVLSSAHVRVLSSEPGEVTLAGDVPKNRRSYPRYRARFAVHFETVQEFVLEYAANISAGGVFVVTDFPPEMDQVITVVLELPDGRPPVPCKAQVVHRVTKEEAQARGEPAGVGVQFIEADDTFRERIDQTIAQILEKAPT
jgi:uncharacterized protein (TIGR02266 family)